MSGIQIRTPTTVPVQRVHILNADLHLDPAHALWLPAHRTLVIADLHLGYVWAHRHAGQLMPIDVPDDTLDRIEELAAHYRPAQIVLLGDIVHRAVPVPALKEQIESLCARLAGTTIRWIAGNHDRNLQKLLSQSGLNEIQLEAEARIGPHLLMHGDNASAEILNNIEGHLIIGHEHPAIHLHDRVTTSVKCPCFLAAPRLLVLPAFSPWAAGSNIRNGFLSPIARETSFTHAYAILAGRILPVAL
jgi:uncharacterized protein